MPVNLDLAPGIPIDGVELAPVSAGLKTDGTADLLLIKLREGSQCAGVFTRNTFCAAPVTLARQHLHSSAGSTRAMLINSGNANAGTGEPGLVMAQDHCELAAQVIGVDTDQVLPFSTGVIGQLLPDDIMRAGINKAATQFGNDWQLAARSIMTTDTEPKLTSGQCTVNGQTVTITGMAKGAGMIQPNMATMLAYLFTDASVNNADLQQALRTAVDSSFNAITVDSDTSTNDACMLVATGTSAPVAPTDTDWESFTDALNKVALELAQAIIRDAEGASKFIVVKVQSGNTPAECKSVAYAIANSPLVKTAMFASDANVGRLLMAIGKAEVDGLNPDSVRVSLGGVCAFEHGGIADGYTEERGAAVMAQAEIDVLVELQQGDAQATVYTSDLSHDYVSINADYRS